MASCSWALNLFSPFCFYIWYLCKKMKSFNYELFFSYGEWVFQTLQKGTTAFDTCAGPLSGVVSTHAQDHYYLVWFWRMHRTVVCCCFWWALHSKEEISGQLEQVYVLCQHGKKKIWKVINTDIKKFKWLKNILYLACIYDNINFCKTLGVGNSCYQK